MTPEKSGKADNDSRNTKLEIVVPIGDRVLILRKGQRERRVVRVSG